MLGPVDYAIWLSVLLADICCLVCLLKKRAFAEHFTIALFLTASIGVSIGRYLLLITTGFASTPYFYFYYYSDAVLTICLFFLS